MNLEQGAEKNDLTDLVYLAKKKIKEKTVGTLGQPTQTISGEEQSQCKFFIDTTSQMPGWPSTATLETFCDQKLVSAFDTTCVELNCDDAVENRRDDIEDASLTINLVKSSELIELASRLDPGISTDSVYIKYADDAVPKQPTNNDKVLEKSVITSDFEKRHSIPSYSESKMQIRKKRKKEKESSSGSGWFDMKAAEMTEELRRDLKLIQMRSILDPKRFYKNNDIKNIPKFVQIGKVVDNHADFYNNRVPKKQRKSTIVDELLADVELRQQNKWKYIELQQKNMHKFSKGKKKRK